MLQKRDGRTRVVTNFPTEAHFGQHVWCQNLISASRGAKVAGDVDQLSFSGVGYGTPHHHTSSAEIVDLKDAVPCEPLIPTSLDTLKFGTMVVQTLMSLKWQHLSH
jgi:hypothetical protein